VRISPFLFLTRAQKAKRAQEQLVIHMDQPFEVRYWTTVLGVDEKKLGDLVWRIGPDANRIREYLGNE
jgi:hypothetical protein